MKDIADNFDSVQSVVNRIMVKILLISIYNYTAIIVSAKNENMNKNKLSMLIITIGQSAISTYL